MANRTRRTREKDGKFFKRLAEGRPVHEALADAGYARTTVYEWREQDPEFRARWNEASETAIESMEAEADRRAMEGVQEPLTYQGQVIGYARKYSDTLLMFRLKALAPKRYRDNVRTEHTGPDGVPIDLDLTPERLRDIARAVLIDD